MHRIARLLTVCLATMLLVSFAPTRLTSLGKDATPPTGEGLPGCVPLVEAPRLEVSVTRQFLAKGGIGTIGTTDDRVLFLYHYTFAPSPEDKPGVPQACYPETVLVYVEEGSEPDALAITVHEGAIQVRRDVGTAVASVDRVEATPGVPATTTLGPNDSFLSTGADYSIGNHSDSNQPTVLTVSVLAQDDAGGNPTWPT